MNNISSGTIARKIVLALALINQVLTFFNINPIPISDDEIYSIVTTLFTIGAAVWHGRKTTALHRTQLQQMITRQF